METPAIIIISFVLWWIEVMGLYTLYILFLWEDFYSGIAFEDTKLLLMFFCSIIVCIITLFFNFPGAELVFLLSLIALPFVINQMKEEERLLKEKSLGQDNEEINRLNKFIEREGGDSGIFMRLGYLYKDIEDFENALKNFKKACELTKEEIFPFAEIEIRELGHKINKEKSKKKGLFKLFKNTIKVYPIAIFLAIIFIISAILFWKYLEFFGNFIFYVLLSWNILMFTKKSAGAKVG